MSWKGEVSEGKQLRESKQNKSGSVVRGFLHITAFAFHFLSHSFSHSTGSGLIECSRKVKYWSKYVTYTAALNLNLEPTDMAQTCTL